MRISLLLNRNWIRCTLPKKKAAPERPARKPLPAHLPRVTKTIEPASTCQGALRHISDEVSEKLEYIPARVVVNRYVRPQYGCTCCQRVVSGDMPAHIVPKGMAEASLIAQLVISKHCDHMPLYRQQSVLARSDIHLPVSTMADMVGRAGAALAPLAESLHRMLLTCDVLHADETPLQILDTKKAVKPVPATCGLTSAVKKVARLSFASTASQGEAASSRWNT